VCCPYREWCVSDGKEVYTRAQGFRPYKVALIHAAPDALRGEDASVHSGMTFYGYAAIVAQAWRVVLLKVECVPHVIGLALRVGPTTGVGMGDDILEHGMFPYREGGALSARCN